MQKLTEKHRFATVDRALRFARRRARRRPETSGFVTAITAQRQKLREANDVYLEAVDERIALTAEIKYRDSVIDRLVLVNLKRDLLTLTVDHPSGGKFEKKLFLGVAPSEGMKPIATDSQASYVAGIISRLENDADFAPIKGNAAKLDKAQKDIDVLIAERKKAIVAERITQGDLDLALDEARRFYNQLYPQLSLLFPDDPSLVESYFLDLRAPAAEAAGEPEAEAEAEKPAEPTP